MLRYAWISTFLLFSLAIPARADLINLTDTYVSP